MTNRDFVLWLKDYLIKVDEVPNWHILWNKLNSITDVQTYPMEDINYLSSMNKVSDYPDVYGNTLVSHILLVCLILMELQRLKRSMSFWGQER